MASLTAALFGVRIELWVLLVLTETSEYELYSLGFFAQFVGLV